MQIVNFYNALENATHGVIVKTDRPAHGWTEFTPNFLMRPAGETVCLIATAAELRDQPALPTAAALRTEAAYYAVDHDYADRYDLVVVLGDAEGSFDGEDDYDAWEIARTELVDGNLVLHVIPNR